LILRHCIYRLKPEDIKAAESRVGEIYTFKWVASISSGLITCSLWRRALVLLGFNAPLLAAGYFINSARAGLLRAIMT